ncbi:hypothetical protein CDL15_Pgr026237 [Punica granatum]|uniref:Uncharacterized protein n=1 Tax=Punica granatum TaxID=22663 RepID=A0A218VSE8_PUNGR|nr:hypothetical protein CDL15_Pgr026237 [Punica granatum]
MWFPLNQTVTSVSPRPEDRAAFHQAGIDGKLPTAEGTDFGKGLAATSLLAASKLRGLSTAEPNTAGAVNLKSLRCPTAEHSSVIDQVAYDISVVVQTETEAKGKARSRELKILRKAKEKKAQICTCIYFANGGSSFIESSQSNHICKHQGLRRESVLSVNGYLTLLTHSIRELQISEQRPNA